MPSGSNTDKPPAQTGASEKKLYFINLKRPSRLDWAFALEAVKGMRPFQYDLSPRSEAGQGRLLAPDFWGFCLAVPRDASQCEQILTLVRESRVGAVRLDFTYGQCFDSALSLLQGLRALKVEVLLHLVPPLREGQQFPQADALDRWRAFMEKSHQTFEGYFFEGYFEALEIGSTINRAKWSGYHLAGFLAMWQIAHAYCHTHKITLVGPNVTDFEPQYNAGTLGVLKGRNQLPDVHSNNLFAERSVEPEDADHKILGYEFRNLHGYDLRKKMSLITEIAKRNGVQRNWSTCAFWTVPRIARILARPEEQMADYLVRYYLLCISHGGFERIFWGPLVSYREGLVDDGTEDRSSSDDRDVVALYDMYPGTHEQWRPRPAFGALRNIILQLSGFHYVAPLCSHRGLEIHEFRRQDEVCWVAWTMNGRLARVRDCMDASSLDALEEVVARDGDAHEDCPDFISESPLYFHWKNGISPKINKRAKCLPEVVAARPPKGMQYYEFQSERWQGILLARSQEEARALSDSLQPESVGAQQEAASLRKSRNAIWTVADPRDPEGVVVIKKPNRIAWHKRILDRKKPSKALRSWNGTSELMRRGIETPRVVAYFESRQKSDMLENWFICEHVEGGLSVREFFSRFANGETLVEGFTLEAFSKELIPFVLDMHMTNIFFRDLAGGNVLVELSREHGIRFSLIDTARVKCPLFGLKIRHRIEDMKRLTNKLNNAQQLYVMELYLGKLGRSFTMRQKFSFKLYAIKTKLKRQKRRAFKKLRK